MRDSHKRPVRPGTTSSLFLSRPIPGVAWDGPAEPFGLRLLRLGFDRVVFYGDRQKGEISFGSENYLVVHFCGALLGLLYLLGLAERPNGKDSQRLLHRWP